MDNQAILNTIYKNYSRIKENPHFKSVTRAVDLIKVILSTGKTQTIYASFNGGKDATVAIFLMFLALKQLQKPINIKCLYFEEPNSFQEMEQFIQKLQRMLNLEMNRLKSKSYQIQLLNFTKNHQIDFIVMGSRKEDPGCAKLGELAQSDVHKGYPDFTRVNPIIQWSCSFLWQVIKQLNLPYCKLYDEGYTSVGNKKNTEKNPNLKDSKTNQYLPAYKANDKDQRINRAP